MKKYTYRINEWFSITVFADSEFEADSRFFRMGGGRLKVE